MQCKWDLWDLWELELWNGLSDKESVDYYASQKA